MHFGDWVVQMHPPDPSCHHPSFRRSITIVGRSWALFWILGLAAELTQEAGTARATLGPASRRHRPSALLVLEKRRCMSETAWLCTVGVIGIDECGLLYQVSDGDHVSWNQGKMLVQYCPV